MKTRRISFDVDKAKAGAKVVTRCGGHVRLGLYDAKYGDFPLVGVVDDGDGIEVPRFFMKDGRHNKYSESRYDLFIEVEEVEETDDYDPYKATVESVDDIVERCSEFQSIEEFIRIQCRNILEKCKEQDEKPADNKPKFQEGDWVVFYPGCNAHQIVRVVENTTSHTYGYVTVDDYCFNDTAEGVRLWNITDAKPGDVLAIGELLALFQEIDRVNIGPKIKCYCSYDGLSSSRFKFFVPSIHSASLFHPATKEQCDLLFQKIKEAGYEWNSDTKELKKIDAFPTEKKSKTRRMTNQELSWWLRDCQQERREVCRVDEDTIYSRYIYRKCDADEEVPEFVRIRKNGGEWEEPLVEL